MEPERPLLERGPAGQGEANGIAEAVVVVPLPLLLPVVPGVIGMVITRGVVVAVAVVAALGAPESLGVKPTPPSAALGVP